MMIEPYLVLGGVEIANSLRTLTYLRRGLAGADVYVSVANPLVVAEGGGYSDVYDDHYSYYLDSYRTANLTCFCETIDGGPYQDPAHDGAPWYDAARPESAEFLGMVVEATLAPVAKRPVTGRAGGGASLGAISLGPRLVQVSGVMYAGSRAGMVYGERWLARALAGSSGCGDDTLTILPACPPAEAFDGSAYLRELVGVGVIDGPFHDPVASGVPECVEQAVTFQLASGDPYLRYRFSLLEEAVAASSQCATVEASAAAADAAAVLTLTAGATMLDGVEVTATTPDGTVAGYTVVEMPARSTLVIDSSRRTVELTDDDGAVIGGLDVVDFDGVFPWFVAPVGSSVEICVDGTTATFGPGAQVAIDQVDREL